jgi:hypothetical protein
MRRIESENDKEKRKKRTMLIISLFMLATLVLGTVGYGFLAGPGAYQDNSNADNDLAEGTLVNVGNQWALNLDGQTFLFSNSPESVKEIPVDITFHLYSFSNAPLYIDSENQAVNLELTSTMQRLTSRMQEACLDSCPDRNVPEKTCEDNIIIWKDSTENKVYQEENCIFIEGDLLAVDAFLYKILGYEV